MPKADSADRIAARQAERIARDSQRCALRDEWQRIQAAPTEDELPTSTLMQYVHRSALVACLRVTEQGESESDRVRACEAIFRLRIEEARLLSEMAGTTQPQAAIVAASLLQHHPAAAVGVVASGDMSALLTRDEAVEELQRRRKQQLQGMR
jgi:hypothetical protein